MDKNVTEEDKRPHINLAIIGHANAGKSTTVGHLIAKSGSVTKEFLK